MLWLFVGPTGVYLLDFFCSGIQFNLLLSPYPCFRQKHNQIGIDCFTFCKIKKFLKSFIFDVDRLFDISDI